MNATLSSATARDVLAGALNDVEERALPALRGEDGTLGEDVAALIVQGDEVLRRLDLRLAEPDGSPPESAVSEQAAQLVDDFMAAVYALAKRASLTAYRERYRRAEATRAALLDHIAQLELSSDRANGRRWTEFPEVPHV